MNKQLVQLPLMIANGFQLKTRNAFCGTWYLPHSTSTVNELLWSDALRVLYARSMCETAVFPLVV